MIADIRRYLNSEVIVQHFRRLKESDSILSIVSIAALTIFIKIFAALKEIVVAYRYGVSSELDAYLIAYMYATFMINIMAGSFSSALVPAYIRIKQNRGFAAGRELISNITGWSAVLLIVTAVCLVLASPWLVPFVGSGFDSHTMALTLRMIPILITVVLFFGLSSIWSPVINSHHSFKFPALTPVFPSLGIICCVLICPKSWGGYSLAVGTASGYFVEMLLIGFWLRHFGLSPIPELKLNKQLKDIGVQLLPLMFAAMMSTGMGVVDQSMAAMLDKGSVAVLNFGYRIVGIVFSLSAAIWIVALPKFSILASEKNYSILQRTLRTQIKAIMTFAIPLVIVLIVFSQEIVRIIYERGAFTSEDTKAVACIQAYYVIQTPFFISSGLMMRMLSSLSQNRILMLGGALALGMNIALNIILIKYLKVAGIALSTSFVSAITFCFLFVVLNSKLKGMQKSLSL